MPSRSRSSYITETMEFHPVIPVLCPIKIWLNYSVVFRKASGLDFRSPGKMFAPNAPVILKWDGHLIPLGFSYFRCLFKKMAATTEPYQYTTDFYLNVAYSGFYRGGKQHEATDELTVYSGVI